METRETIKIGAKIRKLREEQGYNVSEMAKIVGLTTSMLSQVERDIVRPSISSLRRIADALHVPAFYFLIEPDELHDTVVRKNKRTTLQPAGYNATFQLLSPDLNKRIEMIYIKLEPGEATCDTPMAHEGEECLVVIQGRFSVILPDNEVTIQEGDSIYFDRRMPHQVINIGDGTASAICAITPPSY